MPSNKEERQSEESAWVKARREFNLGENAQKEGDFKAAIKYFKKAGTIDPGHSVSVKSKLAQLNKKSSSSNAQNLHSREGSHIQWSAPLGDTAFSAQLPPSILPMSTPSSKKVMQPVSMNELPGAVAAFPIRSTIFSTFTPNYTNVLSGTLPTVETSPPTKIGFPRYERSQNQSMNASQVAYPPAGFAGNIPSVLEMQSLNHDGGASSYLDVGSMQRIRSYYPKIRGTQDKHCKAFEYLQQENISDGKSLNAIVQKRLQEFSVNFHEKGNYDPSYIDKIYALCDLLRQVNTGLRQDSENAAKTADDICKQIANNTDLDPARKSCFILHRVKIAAHEKRFDDATALGADAVELACRNGIGSSHRGAVYSELFDTSNVEWPIAYKLKAVDDPPSHLRWVLNMEVAKDGRIFSYKRKAAAIAALHAADNKSQVFLASQAAAENWSAPVSGIPGYKAKREGFKSFIYPARKAQDRHERVRYAKDAVKCALEPAQMFEAACIIENATDQGDNWDVYYLALAHINTQESSWKKDWVNAACAKRGIDLTKLDEYVKSYTWDPVAADCEARQGVLYPPLLQMNDSLHAEIAYDAQTSSSSLSAQSYNISSHHEGHLVSDLAILHGNQPSSFYGNNPPAPDPSKSDQLFAAPRAVYSQNRKSISRSTMGAQSDFGGPTISHADTAITRFGENCGSKLDHEIQSDPEMSAVNLPTSEVEKTRLSQTRFDELGGSSEYVPNQKKLPSLEGRGAEETTLSKACDATLLTVQLINNLDNLPEKSGKDALKTALPRLDSYIGYGINNIALNESPELAENTALNFKTFCVEETAKKNSSFRKKFFKGFDILLKLSECPVRIHFYQNPIARVLYYTFPGSETKTSYIDEQFSDKEEANSISQTRFDTAQGLKHDENVLNPEELDHQTRHEEEVEEMSPQSRPFVRLPSIASSKVIPKKSSSYDSVQTELRIDYDTQALRTYMSFLGAEGNEKKREYANRLQMFANTPDSVKKTWLDEAEGFLQKIQDQTLPSLPPRSSGSYIPPNLRRSFPANAYKPAREWGVGSSGMEKPKATHTGKDAKDIRTRH